MSAEPFDGLRTALVRSGTLDGLRAHVGVMIDS